MARRLLGRLDSMGDQSKGGPSERSSRPQAPADDSAQPRDEPTSRAELPPAAVAQRIGELSTAVAEQAERLLEEVLDEGDRARILEAARRSSELARELVSLTARERDLARRAMLGLREPSDSQPSPRPLESQPVRSYRRLRSSADTAFVVLLVDDEPLLLKTLCRMLEQYSHRVISAGSAREALELVEREASLDVLVTDVALPGMTGGELAVKARALRPELRVLYTSGWDAVSAGLRVAEDGTEAFLSKPFTAAELHACLCELLATPLARRVREASGPTRP